MKQLLIIALAAFATANVNAQNVGIGEASPVQKLQIDGSATGLQTIRIEDLATNQAGDFGQTSGANVQTSTTTSKGVYADANGDLTARYVYGDNVQSTILSGAVQNITSATLVDITGATLTFTPRHSTVYLSAVIAGYNPLTASQTHSSWLVVGVNKGGTNVANFLTLTAEMDDVTGSSGAGMVTIAHFPLSVTPGTPVTIKLQGRVGGTGSSDTFAVDKVNYTSYMTILD
jgi:hypothetical protein